MCTHLWLLAAFTQALAIQRQDLLLKARETHLSMVIERTWAVLAVGGDNGYYYLQKRLHSIEDVMDEIVAVRFRRCADSMH